MTDAFNRAQKLVHGGHCDCELLAQAFGIDPRHLLAHAQGTQDAVDDPVPPPAMLG